MALHSGFKNSSTYSSFPAHAKSGTPCASDRPRDRCASNSGMDGYYGSLPAILVEAAPPTVRCTAVALGYNLCMGLFGGLSPLVATWLVERTGDEIAPAFLIMASAAVTFVTIFWFRETYRTSFGVAPTAAA